MTKKILYIVLVVAIIIILAILWKEPKTEAPATSSNDVTTPTSQVETKASIGNELNNMNIDAGIDQDLNGMDKDIKSL